MNIFKDVHVNFQAKRVGNIYMLRNSKVTVGELQLSSALRSEVVEQSETMMVSSSNVHFYPEGRLRLDSTDVKQESSKHYSFVGANSQKSCMDQGDRWVIKYK